MFGYLRADTQSDASRDHRGKRMKEVGGLDWVRGKHKIKGDISEDTDPTRCDRGAVELLKLARSQEDERIRLNLSLMVNRLGRMRRVWTKGQSTQCRRSDLEKVARKVEGER